MTGQSIAYRRVSTVAQNTERQLDGIVFDKEFVDKVSGSNTDRPQLMALVGHIRKGDTVHVHSIDRLARNLADLLLLVKMITDKDATLRFEKEGLVFTGDGSAMQELQLSIMGAVAQFERSIINERAAEGRAIAKSKGVRFGRKSALTSQQVSELCAAHGTGKSIRALAIDYNVGRSTISRALASRRSSIQTN